MKKNILAISLAVILTATSFGETEHVKVSLVAKGGDIRATFASLFEQAKKPYVLPVDLKATVYLSLQDMDFDSALKVLCKSSGLVAECQEGIYYIHSAKANAENDSNSSAIVNTTPAVKPAGLPRQTSSTLNRTSTEKPNVRKSAISPAGNTFIVGGPTKIIPTNSLNRTAPSRVLPMTVLDAKVSARVQKGDIRKLFGEFAKQANVRIELGPEIPAYRIDAYLLNTSLKYALDKITDAAGLEYKFTENYSIAISKPKGDRVAINK